MFKNKKVLIALISVVLVGGVSWIVHSAKDHQSGQHDIYYCPMHPTYTSDRPGDCPICNMKLVKKERAAAPAQNSQASVSKQLKDICVLHNCAKAHNGKSCPMLMVGKEGETIDCPVCGKHVVEEGKVKKILYWTDPMIPGYKADKPGKSPMGMDLVPVYEEETPQGQPGTAAPGYAEVMLSPAKRQMIGIKTAPVIFQDIHKTIRAVGVIAHDTEWYQTEAEFIESLKRMERVKQSGDQDAIDEAQRFLDASRIRLKHIGLNDELINEIATWPQADENLIYASSGKPVWVYAQVYEYELPYIKLGQPIQVNVPSVPNQKFSGTIRGIDTTVNPETRTVRIRAQIENPNGELKLGMYIDALVEAEIGKVLAVPTEAVFDTGNRQVVFVDKGEGVLEPRDVKVGGKAENFYEVQSGLKEGEKVVTSGNFLIDSESRLKASLEGVSQGTTSDGGHQHGQ